jgi:hypothetical protein
MSEDNTPALTMEYLLGKIDQIASDTAYLREVITALQRMQSAPEFADNPMGDNAGAEKAEALSDVVKCRETTNQQMIALYKQMYEDIRSPGNNKLDQLRQVTEIFKNASTPSLPFVQEIAEKMLGLPCDD